MTHALSLRSQLTESDSSLPARSQEGWACPRCSVQANTNRNPVKIILLIVGMAIAAAGGVIAYRALFVEPATAVLLTQTEVRELPNTLRVAGGCALVIIGAVLAFFGARRLRG